MFRFRSMIVCAGVVGIAASASAVNILTNPGFETGDLSGWTTNGFTINNDTHTGQFSVFTRGNFWVRQDFAAVNVSDVNEVSVWTKQPNRVSYFFAFNLFYGDTSSEQVLGSGTSSGTYVKHDFTSQLDAGKTLVGVRAWGYTSGDPTVDFTFHDDFVVDAVPEPATALVLFVGAAAAAFRRRKRATS